MFRILPRTRKSVTEVSMNHRFVKKISFFFCFQSQSNASNEDDEMDLSNYEYIKTSATNIHPNLSALVNYCQSIKFPGFKKLGL